MSLALVVGPAKAGKIARLLEGYLAEIERDPVLIVPNRADVDRIERDLLQRTGALLAGSIGTFDDVFRELALGGRTPGRSRATHSARWSRGASWRGHRSTGSAGPRASPASRTRCSRRSRSWNRACWSRINSRAIWRCSMPPTAQELDRLALWDRDLLRRHAVERLRSDLAAWDGRPVFAYGFEDLTGAEWGLLEALSGRTEVTVSLPYEPGRAAFASLRRTQEDLASLAGGRIEELPARAAEYGHAALAHLERHLFADTPPAGPALDGAIRFFEGAGARGSLELTAEEIRELVAAGTPPEEIALVVPSVERWRASLETVLGALGIPFTIEGRVRLGQTPFGQALLALLRFEWQQGGRRDLYGYLRSPFSGFTRSNVDFLEGRLRGRGVSDARHRGGGDDQASRRTAAPAARGAPQRDRARAGRARDGRGDAARGARPRGASGGRGEPRRPPRLRRDRAPARRAGRLARARRRALGGRGAGGARARRGAHRLGRRAAAGWRSSSSRGPAPAASTPSSCSASRRARCRGAATPLRSSTTTCAASSTGTRASRLVRPDPVERERYLFYTACTRATRRLTLVREAATDEGSPREPSPFWDEVVALFEPEDVAALDAPAAALAAHLGARGRADRARAAARARAARGDGAGGRRGSGGRERLGAPARPRARRAFTRETRLKHPRVLAELSAKTPFNVTELERFADCSSAWFFERLISPRQIDRKVDAMLRGSVAHTTLHRFYAGLPRALGSDRVEESRLDDALAFLGECLEGALGGVKMEMTELERRELEQSLRRDLEQLVRDEARSPLPLVPRKFEVGFGSERSAPELQRGLDLGDGVTLSGKIDRIDLDPGSARGIVQDYKSGRYGHSAAEIEKELRLQIPLYMLVLRDLVGIEPLGGLYRPLAGERRARGLLRAEAKDDVLPGFVKNDYLDEDAFWAQVEGARDLARGLAQRIREGDVRHDPKGTDGCPAWCDLWRMCRIRRA